MLVTLVSLTTCDVMWLSMGSVNCDVTSGQPHSLTLFTFAKSLYLHCIGTTYSENVHFIGLSDVTNAVKQGQRSG